MIGMDKSSSGGKKGEGLKGGKLGAVLCQRVRNK